MAGKEKYDVILVGGGIMGSATAYYLTKMDPKLKVAVVERDPTYERASSTLSMANIRIQFSLKQNVQVSQYAFEVLDRFEDEMAVDDEKPNIAFHREGNLFLVDEKGHAVAKKALDMQKALGCPVDWWSLREIKEHYPLYDASPFLGGTFGPKDGHLDAYAVLMGYKAKARSQGAQYVKDEVTQVLAKGKEVEGVRLASGADVSSKIVVNCAGAWASLVADTVGVQIPVQPVKRQVYALDTAVKPQGPLPLTILPSGLYFRTETGNLILLGWSLEDDPVGFDFSWDKQRFTDRIWPSLAEFVPAFDTLKVVRGWAGLYAVNTLDSNAILGEWPELKGFYLANGFSGHGLQQGPAVGRYISELILGLKPSLDLTIFNPQRILENKPLSEGGIV
ncbi:MAG: FAD-binding oxidoreductase [Desulfobacterota bacterium]|jgi:glycine/D-amino acid oxidase-like deaminating enzyme|nr:FAD-binding oxidoreductase [Thermodesulfobacteriota bacterium]